MSNFEKIGLKKEILHAIKDLGFETPTDIQQKSIPYILQSSKDLIAIAQTGTGKTAAFSLPIIEQIDINSSHVQSIMICPTRELCIQITKDIKTYTKYLPEVTVIPIYGGTRIDAQIRELRRGKNIVVGTPGRVLDLINRKKLKINEIRWLVIDEADEILNMGFKEELDAILAETPSNKQTLLFSATMPTNVKRIAQKYMRQADEIRIHKKDSGLSNLEHMYYMTHAKDRYQTLRRIADVNPNIYGIVFCRTRRETQEIADKLIHNHYSAEALHGDMSQEQRTLTMNRFRSKQVQLLIATDIAARGLDVNDLTHVISYNLPDSLETYIHRSGRTGRAKKEGISVSIINMKEIHKIRILEKKVEKTFKQKLIPIGDDICKAQLVHLIDKISKVEINESEIESYIQPLYEKLENLSKEDLIKRFVSTEFNRFLSFYKNAPDLNVSVRKNNRITNDRNIKFAPFKINLGNNQNFGPKRLIETIIKSPALRYVKIGQISIGNNDSVFEIDANHQDELIQHLQNTKFKGMPIEISSTEPLTRSSNSHRSLNRTRSSNNHRSSNRTRSSNNHRSSNRTRSGFRGKRKQGFVGSNNQSSFVGRKKK